MKGKHFPCSETGFSPYSGTACCSTSVPGQAAMSPQCARSTRTRCSKPGLGSSMILRGVTCGFRYSSFGRFFVRIQQHALISSVIIDLGRSRIHANESGVGDGKYNPLISIKEQDINAESETRFQHYARSICLEVDPTQHLVPHTRMACFTRETSAINCLSVHVWKSGSFRLC